MKKFFNLLKSITVFVISAISTTLLLRLFIESEWLIGYITAVIAIGAENIFKELYLNKKINN